MADIVGALLSKIKLIDLVEDYTELNQTNQGELRAACPIHKGSNPTAFAIYDDKYFKCFSCGCYGNAIQFYCDVENMAFYQAIEALAEKYSINLSDTYGYKKQKDIIGTNTVNMVKYMKNVGDVKQHLMEKRCLTEEMIEEFKIGFDGYGGFLSNPEKPETKFPGVVFAIWDTYGRVAGFSKRRTDGDFKPKYRNSYEDKDGIFKKSEILYNYNKVRKAIAKDKTLFLAEGFYDCISAHQQGLNCVGYLNGGLTRDHIEILKSVDKMNEGVVFIASMDNDAAGFKETMKLRGKLEKYNANLNIRVFCYPKESYEFPFADDKGVTLRPIKDFNDILVLNHYGVMDTKIAEFPTKHIDMYCLEVLLDDCKGIKESEYHIVDSYVKTVKSQMILSDIARMLAQRWGQELAEVKAYLQVSGDSKVDEILAEFNTIGDAIDKYIEVSDMPVGSIGYPRIDYSFGGTAPKEVILIGAYSKVGKTDVLIEIILHSVLRLQMNCIAFSLEMAKERFIERMLSKLFEVDLYGLKEMMKSPEVAKYIMDAREKLEKYLIIIDTNNLTLDQVKHRVELANLYKFDKPVQRVFCDYFQYLQGTTEFTDIERTAKGMKPFCKDLNVELYMLSQFSRADKPWERPSIASFKGGNSMESSFDKCILLWRPAKDPKMSEIEREAIKYETMVVIESRNGLRGEDTFKLMYNPKTSRLIEA